MSRNQNRNTKPAASAAPAAPAAPDETKPDATTQGEQNTNPADPAADGTATDGAGEAGGVAGGNDGDTTTATNTEGKAPTPETNGQGDTEKDAKISELEAKVSELTDLNGKLEQDRATLKDEVAALKEERDDWRVKAEGGAEARHKAANRAESHSGLIDDLGKK